MLQLGVKYRCNTTLLLVVATTLCLADATRELSVGALSPSEGGLQCPTWTLPSANHSAPATCECADKVDAIVICDPATKMAYMHLRYCMGYIEELDMTVFGSCVYNSYSVYSIEGIANRSSFLRDTHAYYALPQNKTDLSTSCSYLNRRGLLCGKCLAGFNPPLLSFDLKCMNCSNVNRFKNWVILCSRVVIPTTLLYIVALTFQVSLLSPKFSGFILFAQFISSPPLVRQAVLLVGSEPETTFWNKELVYAIISLYGWSNLDFLSLFFPPICDPNFDTFSVFVVNFASLIYPVFLIILTCLFVWLRDRGYRVVKMLLYPCNKVFHFFRKGCNIQCALVDVFASVLLITYVRFLGVSLDMLTAVRLSNIQNKRVGTFYWNYDASLELFRISALPVVVPAFIIIVCVLFLPTILLCGSSVRFFHLLCQRVCQKRSFFLALQAFIDAFQGCYKDGTEPGARNCRFVAALNLFIRVCLYLSYTIILGHHYFIFTISLSLVYTVFIAILRPYKSRYATWNVVEPLMLMLFCLLQVGMLGVILFQTERRNWLDSIKNFILIVCVTPLLYLSCLVLHWLSTIESLQRAGERARSFLRRSLMARWRGVEHSNEDERSFNTYIIGLGNKNYGSTRIQNRTMVQQS